MTRPCGRLGLALLTVFTAFACEKKGDTEAEQPQELTLDVGGGVTMELVLIPAGEFMMGSRDTVAEVQRKGNTKKDWYKNEHPRHRVRITQPFYMGKHEVTQAQYERIMGKNPSKWKGSDLPVERVSWNDATELCRKLSQRTGRKVRLPTEAEWEYACRAGTTTPFHFGETISANQVNYDANYPYAGGAKGTYRRKTTSVGSFPANAWGLHDMHGNLWEWCSDWNDEGYYAKSPGTDPQGPGTAGSRVLRGGSWNYRGLNCRSAYRRRYGPTNRNNYVGFRVAVVAPGR